MHRLTLTITLTHLHIHINKIIAFDPCSSHSTLHTFRTVTLLVKTTFIHGDLDEGIHMSQLVRFTITGEQDHLVWELKKSQYGDRNSIHFTSLGHNRVVRFSTENSNERVHSMLTWKTQIWEKPRQPTDCRISLCQDYTMGHTEATTSCSLPSPLGGYNRGNNLFISLSLSNCTPLRSITKHTQLYNNT